MRDNVIICVTLDARFIVFCGWCFEVGKENL